MEKLLRLYRYYYQGNTHAPDGQPIGKAIDEAEREYSESH